MCIATRKGLDNFWMTDVSEAFSCAACEGASLCHGECHGL